MRSRIAGLSALLTFGCASAELKPYAGDDPPPDVPTGVVVPDGGVTGTDPNSLHGVLDEEFGAFGYAYGFRGSIDGLAMAADDTIFVNGTHYNDGRCMGVAHYVLDGVVDYNFGDEGIVDTTRDPFLTNDASASQILIRDNGAMFAIGRVVLPEPEDYRGIVVVALDKDGEVDTTFGDSGRVLPRLPTAESTNAVPVDAVLAPNGSIAVGGFVPGNPPASFVALIAPWGDIEGAQELGDQMRIYAMATGPSGEIVAAGYERNGTDGARDVSIVRLTSDVKLDHTFADGGRFKIDLQPVDEISDVAVRPDGKIVAVGNALALNGAPRSFIIQLNLDGTLDEEFGTGGLQPIDNLGIATLGPMAIAADGKIVIAGEIKNTGSTRPMVLRFNADGAPDTSFGTREGVTVFHDIETPAYPIRVAFDSEGRIVVGGAYGDVVRFFLIRLLP